MPLAKKRQLLIIMLGTLGAGKSHFSRHLAKEMGAERLSVDNLRRRLFKSVEEWLQPANNKKVYDLLDKHTEQALAKGNSVIRDSRHDSRSKRDGARELANKTDALTIAVWINTHPELAIDRAMARPEADDTIKLDEDFIRDRSYRHAKEIEPPEDDELAIEIDGRLPLQKQMESFKQQLQNILSIGCD